MRNLEIRIADGENAAVVDLFDQRHWHNVLVLLGRAHSAR